jgi:hypothetical protein
MRPNLRAVTNFGRAFLFSAIGAAINPSVLLNAVTDNSAIAMRAGRRHHVNSTFKAVESPSLAILYNPESFIILVTAMIAFSHCRFPL